MKAEDVVWLLQELERIDVPIWLDGGWGVDALLVKQTRPHADVDIVIQQKDVPKLRRLLEAEGYRDIPRNDTSAWNFVLGDGQGHEVDVHAIVFDADGNGIYGPPERGVMYPAASLSGVGVVAGRVVKCIAAEHLVRFHTGYKLRETDFEDVRALCERFGLEYPAEYLDVNRSD